MIGRREVLAGAASAALTVATAQAQAVPKRNIVADARLKDLETGAARLGVCFLDTRSLETIGNRATEHFAMCSTFKMPLAGAILREADAGRLDLAEKLPFTKADLLPWAPVTSANLATGAMSIGALAQAAQEVSDGAAANLLIKRLGGPVAVTALWRQMGDQVTRLDRYEPHLTMVLSGDMRDTTTPLAMAQLARGLTTGALLTPASRQTLLSWMFNTNTGAKRLRAGIPAEWKVGNKTGTGRDPGSHRGGILR
jgi:beta-lactamase class A